MLLFMDGCSHYSTSELANKWTAVSSTNCTWDVVPGEGRAGGCIKRTATANGSAGRLTFAPLMMQTAEWTPTYSGVFGAALKIDSVGAYNPLVDAGIQGFSNTFFSVWAGSKGHFTIQMNNDGTLTLYRQSANGGVVICANSIQGFTNGTYAYLEIKWVLSTNAATADGSLIIRVNENVVLNYSGILFCGTQSGFPNPPREWTSIRFLGQQSDPSPLLVQRICDIYLIDLNAPNGDFLGDIRVAYIKPDGVGASSAWTPLSPPNWSEVNEVPPDGDTSYVEATAVGTRDTYEFEDVIGDPVAIQVCNFVRKTDVAGAGLKVVTRQGGVDYDGPEIGIGSDTYTYRLQPYDTNPATSAQWTQAEMNAGQWGPLKSS